MNLKKQEKFLQDCAGELYRFASVLIPGQSMAQNLVKDAMQVLLFESFDLVKNFCHSPNYHHGVKMKKYLYGKIFELAKQRGTRLKNNFKTNHPDFYSLSLEQRGILFLKHRTRFNYAELEEIVNLFRHEIITRLFDAREKIMSPES